MTPDEWKADRAAQRQLCNTCGIARFKHPTDESPRLDHYFSSEASTIFTHIADAYVARSIDLLTQEGVVATDRFVYA